MPTKKIGELTPLPKSVTCRDREHNPAGMRVYSPGIYEHTCPSCGHVTRFTVARGPHCTAVRGLG